MGIVSGECYPVSMGRFAEAVGVEYLIFYIGKDPGIVHGVIEEEIVEYDTVFMDYKCLVVIDGYPVEEVFIRGIYCLDAADVVSEKHIADEALVLFFDAFHCVRSWCFWQVSFFSFCLDAVFLKKGHFVQVFTFGNHLIPMFRVVRGRGCPWQRL